MSLERQNQFQQQVFLEHVFVQPESCHLEVISPWLPVSLGESDVDRKYQTLLCVGQFIMETYCG